MIRYATLLLAFVCTPAGFAEIPVGSCAASDTKTVVILVRHAERGDGERLIEKGWSRARTLRDVVFEQFGAVNAVLHTTVARTEETVRPTRTKAGNIPAWSREPRDHAGIAKLIRDEHAKGRDRTVLLYSGHSNTVRPILEQFNAEQVEQHMAEWFRCERDLCHSDYDGLWSVTLCGGNRPEIRRTSFGEPSDTH